MHLPGATPWPSKPPDTEIDCWGWFGDPHETLFSKIDPQPIKLIVEAGSFLGRSTQYLLEQFPNAHIVCVDHWEGDPAWYLPHREKQMGKYLPNMFDRFVVNMWDHRDRITLYKRPDPPALREVARHVVPDLVYLDGSHAYENVLAQLKVCKERWNDSIITGDDFAIQDIQKAIGEVYPGRPILSIKDRAWRLLDG